MIILGIDPGIKTGIAIFPNGKLAELRTIEPWRVSDVLDEQQPGSVIMEDSRLQSHIWTRAKTSKAAAMKIARNVGTVDAWCTLIAAMCAERNIDLICVSPKDKGEKTKYEEFLRITGWKEPSNQHERDSALVAWPYRSMKGK